MFKPLSPMSLCLEISHSKPRRMVSGETKLGENVCGTLDGVLLHQAEGRPDQEGKHSQS